MPIYKTNGKKDGLQKYNVRINYIDDFGKSKQLTRIAYGSEAAKDLERQLSSSIKTIGEAITQNMTVHQLFEKHFSTKKYEIRESTLDKQMRNYELYIRPIMENVRIEKLSVSVLMDWKRFIDEKGLAIGTKKTAYSLFRATLNFAVKMEFIEKNPLLKAGNFKDTSGIKKEMKIYTAEQFSKFINTAKHLAEERQENEKDLSEWDYYVFFNIAYYTGLRKGEIHALKWSDINGSLLSVKHSITQKLKGDDRETAPKNSSSFRTLQIPKPLIQALNDHRNRQEQLDHFTEDYRICGGERCIRDTTVSKRNIHYASLSGLDVISIHSYRHSHASLLANEGINIQEIARRLGHARVEMTWNTYSHLYPREEERAVEILNRIA